MYHYRVRAVPYPYSSAGLMHSRDSEGTPDHSRQEEARHSDTAVRRTWTDPYFWAVTWTLPQVPAFIVSGISIPYAVRPGDLLNKSGASPPQKAGKPTSSGFVGKHNRIVHSSSDDIK